jgi:hypothetical protein
MYTEYLMGETPEEAKQKAEVFKKNLDLVQGPISTYGPYETIDGQWKAVVTYYGFD